MGILSSRYQAVNETKGETGGRVTMRAWQPSMHQSLLSSG